MQHQIPIAVLVRAAAALKAIKDMPTGAAPTVPQWHAVMVSSNEMHSQLDILLKGQTVPVAAPLKDQLLTLS